MQDIVVKFSKYSSKKQFLPVNDGREPVFSVQYSVFGVR